MRALKKSQSPLESEELKQAFETHAEESAKVKRLQQVFEIIGKPASSKTCEAMQGLTAEMDEDVGESPAADAVLIACAQAAEHYEIARYGTLKTWAGQLGFEDAAKLLNETLQQEKKTDELLTTLAAKVNAEGKASGGEEEKSEDAKGPAKGRGRK